MSMDRRNSFLMTALVVLAAAWAALAYAQQPKGLPLASGSGQLRFLIIQAQYPIFGFGGIAAGDSQEEKCALKIDTQTGETWWLMASKTITTRDLQWLPIKTP